MPPTKPTLPVFDAIAASTPTRNEPSCSLKTTDCTFGRSTTSSMMTNFTFGNSAATVFSAGAWAKPVATITVAPRCASLRSDCSRCDSFGDLELAIGDCRSPS